MESQSSSKKASTSPKKTEDKLYKGHPLQVAGMAAWKKYWASMPPKPVYPRECCVCGKPIPEGRKYFCEDH